MIVSVLMASTVAVAGSDTDEKAPGYKYEVLSGMPSASRIKTIGTGIPEIIIEASPSSSSPGIGRDEGEGREVWTCTDENAISGNVAMSADGRWVAIGYSLNDLRLEVRDGEDGDLVFSYPVEYGASRVAMTADGDQIGYAALDSVWLFRLMGEGVPFFRVGLDGYGPGPIGLTRNGEYLVVTGNDPDHERNRVWCFRNAQPDPVWTFEVPEEDVFAWYGLSIARDNSVVVVNGKYHLYVLDLESGKGLWDRPTYNTESSIALSGDASVLCVSSLSGMLTTYVRERNGDGYREIWRYRFSGGIASWVTTCRVSTDGRTIAAGTLDFYEDRYEGRLAMFETYGDGEPVWVCEPLGDEVSDVAMSDDGNIIAASSWGDIDNQRPDLVVHERFSSEPFFTLSTPGSMRGIAISDDGSKVVVGGKAVL